MTDRGDLESRLEGLEDRFGVGPTACVVVGISKDNEVEWPDDVSREDIVVTREEPGVEPGNPLVVEEVAVPIHRPPRFRGGVVVMSLAEVAWVFDSMPVDVRERERDLRKEEGKAIPGVLEE